MTQTLVRLDRLKFSLTTGGLVCAKPATVATEGKVLLTIPTNSATDYSLAVAANWVATGVAVDINGTTSTAWPALSATAASNVTGKQEHRRGTNNHYCQQDDYFPDWYLFWCGHFFVILVYVIFYITLLEIYQKA